MVIANPIYDVVFKRMMENDKVAKFFISTLLEKNIESIEVKPQEFTYTDQLAGLSVFRLDFIAIVKSEEGSLSKILIEIQKAKNEVDLKRFRNYLGEQYKKEEQVKDEKAILPITTIYILGFKLDKIDTPCIKIERNYKDLVNKKTIDTKNEWIEKLTHDSFIVQVEKITDRYQTRLDKLLSVFEQRNFVDDKKIVKEYNHDTDVAEVKLITDILHHTVTDPQERKKIEDEQEAWRTVDAMSENLHKELKIKDEIISEKDNLLSEKDRLIAELQKKLNEK